MKITMAELAKKCGYSKATISRALADDPRVKSDTKQHILEMAHKYNYQPHAVASNLARRRTKTIGMLFPAAPRSLADPFFLEYLQGVSDILFEGGYSLLFPKANVAEPTEPLKEMLAQRRVDGIILTEPRIADPRIAYLQTHRIPFAFLGNTMTDKVSWVDGDNIHGAYQAVLELARLGHRQIAIITGEEGLVASQNRLTGYQKALSELNLPVQKDFIWEGDFTREGGAIAVQRHLEEHGELVPTAIFASNDLMAIGAIQALERAGYGVPGDISVFGFDGIEMGKFLSPPLTTMRQPIYSLGQHAAQILLTQIEQATTPHQVTLPVELINRGSTVAKIIR